MDGQEFIFHGSKVGAIIPHITAMRARKMMRKKGCQAFLLSVVTNKIEEVTIDRVPVICEYEDVFPKDLPGLAPDRQVEFTIDLVPGVVSVSNAPYRMTPNELQELKVQLQELLLRFFFSCAFL